MKRSAALYLSAREASAELAISPATLYAYVSRGLIRSEPSSDSRSHRYRAEDVRLLKQRRTPSPEPRGLRIFDADLPVMDSAIATITEDGPIYRGVNCIELAEKDTLEHAATLLWDVAGVDAFSRDNCPLVSGEMRAVADAARHAAPIDRTIAVLALAASADSRAFTRAAEGRAMVGGRILRLVVATMLNRSSSGESLHLQIASAWAPDNKHAADLIRRALVLLADHELNASTFTVRCAASTGLNLYDAIIAGLVALKGPKHGGAGVLAAQLVKTLVDGDVAPIIRERVALGERFAGFGHGVYKHGDPRARIAAGPVARGRGAEADPGDTGTRRGGDRRIRQYRLCARGAGAHAGPGARQRTGAVCHGAHSRMDRACLRTIAAWRADPPPRALHRSGTGAQPGIRQALGPAGRNL